MSLLQKGFGMTDPTHIRRFTAQFDTELKTSAVRQFMEQNCASFEQATNALGYEQGVDFLYFVEEGNLN